MRLVHTAASFIYGQYSASAARPQRLLGSMATWRLAASSETDSVEGASREAAAATCCCLMAVAAEELQRLARKPPL